jgi:hypothetical protein
MGGMSEFLSENLMEIHFLEDLNICENNIKIGFSEMVWEVVE